MTELAQDGKASGVVSLLARWRRMLPEAPGWSLFALAVAAVMALPLATVALLSLSARESVWPHLIRTVLPGVESRAPLRSR